MQCRDGGGDHVKRWSVHVAASIKIVKESTSTRAVSGNVKPLQSVFPACKLHGHHVVWQLLPLTSFRPFCTTVGNTLLIAVPVCHWFGSVHCRSV